MVVWGDRAESTAGLVGLRPHPRPRPNAVPPSGAAGVPCPTVAAVLYALFAGVAYGTADFTGGLVTRRHAAVNVIFITQAISLTGVVLAMVVVGFGEPTRADLLWGVAGGAAVPLALVSLYRALAIGPMSTAASLTALVGAGTPIVAGLLLGERPELIGLAGMALTFPAIWLISVEDAPTTGPESGLDGDPAARSTSEARGMRRLALIAGVGFGTYFIFLSRYSEDAGLSPLIAVRLTSLVLLGVLILRAGTWSVPDRRWWPHLLVAGVLEAAANAALLAAFDGDNLAWVSAISSLYPASTILLARIILHERFSRTQLAGLSVAATALVMVALGR